jgi:hypothetical protein
LTFAEAADSTALVCNEHIRSIPLRHNRAMLNAFRLRELFDYDPETGAFIRLVHRGGEHPGAVAGSIDDYNGYIRIGVDGVNYKAHRLAWLYVTGEWPNDVLDHINLDRSDNRFGNLRLATVAENNQHVHAPRSDSKSRRRGVTWFPSRGVWRATINVNGRQRHLGYFHDLEEASGAYEAAKAALHPFSVPTYGAVRAS